ncbi:transglutaminase domain-containing protein [Tamlana sp. I1]|uniref:transglutaminase family protein n=1 Tax=Tamlana sp. I1 TaxID=2762061 RepID=UPI00188EBEFD|nr:transglutaminase family protein [Tamlana sp. I1]
MPKFYIKHTTQYNYSDLVFDAANQMMLHPVQDEFQSISSHTLSITNNPKIESRKDSFGNTVATIMIIEPHRQLSIISEIEVRTSQKSNPEDTMPALEQWEALKQLHTNPLFIDYLKHKPFNGSAEILELIKNKALFNLTPFKATVALSDYVFNHFKYIKGITNVDSNLNDVWELKAGVCQDFTILLLQLVRMLGIPARYVSGYICPNESASRGEGATHAWVEVYIPFYGWIGLDPTNNLIANEFHVRLSVGRNYKDCTPVKGIYKGNVEEDLIVKVEINTTKNTDPFSNNDATYTKNQNSYRQSLERPRTSNHQQQQQQ